MSKPAFFFVQTEDGSPSLRLGAPETVYDNMGEERSESMHSLKGAFSETLYIYGSAITTCLEKGFQPQIMSLGLGLGYVELLASALILKDGRFQDSAGGESFELVPELREYFAAWLKDPLSIAVPEEFRSVYDEILKRTAEFSKVAASEIRVFLSELIESGRWLLSGALDAQTRFARPSTCVCFDAFSSKTSPDLWTETFLTQFLDQATSRQCVLATYACTGALKRSLRAAGFELTIREGFSSKRDSTFAVREK